MRQLQQTARLVQVQIRVSYEWQIRLFSLNMHYFRESHDALFFLAALDLHCRAWASSYGGFSCCGARALGVQASVVVVHGLNSCGMWAQ